MSDTVCFKEFSLLLGYSWTVNNGNRISKSQVEILLNQLSINSEAIAESSRYYYTVTSNTNRYTVRSPKFKLLKLRFLTTKSIEKQVRLVWSHLRNELSKKTQNDDSLIILRAYTNIESDKHAALQFKFTSLAWLIHNLVQNNNEA